MASPHLVEQVGRVLDGRYRVVSPIGTGASAAVYLADDTTLRRRVALKVLHAALAGDQGFLKRFQTEAHTAAALSHPNIMRVLDWGEAGDGPFLVLEYLGGGSLRSLLDEYKTLSPEQATQVGIQACRALEYAHRRGLVHRDVKPANLLFDDEGRLAIADFGLARALAEAAWTEPGGAVLGTARYASPEQVRGLSLDGKADVYALGLVLYEAVMGSVPFTADTTIATLMARLDKKVDLPDNLGPLKAVIEGATDPNPETRFDSAQLLKALEQAAAQMPTPERLVLPGAIAIDIDKAATSDPTMLPGTTGEQQAVSLEARPLPPETHQRRFPGLRFLPLGRKKSADAVAMAATKRRRFRMRKPSVKQAIVGVIFAVLLAGAGGGAYGLYYFTGSQRPVPQLEGLTLDGARSAAEQANVRFEFAGEEYSEEVPAGTTFGQSPAPGTEIYPRQSASVKVSKGPKPRQVNSYIGQPIDAARGPMEQAGFKIVTEDRYDESIPKGQILEQTPAEGEAAKGSEVRFVLSGGPRPRTIPDVKGRSREEASASITDEQLRVTFREDFSDSVPAGRVAGTTPGAGAQVERGATVTVLISKGPDLITVPNLSGASEAAAISQATSAGLNVNNRYGPPTGGTVFATEPAAGAKVKRGASIALYLR